MLAVGGPVKSEALENLEAVECGRVEVVTECVIDELRMKWTMVNCIPVDLGWLERFGVDRLLKLGQIVDCLATWNDQTNQAKS